MIEPFSTDLPFKRKSLRYFEGRNIIRAAMIAANKAMVPMAMPVIAPVDNLLTDQVSNLPKGDVHIMNN